MGNLNSLDLTNLSKEQKDAIMKIVNKNHGQPVGTEKIKEDYDREFADPDSIDGMVQELKNNFRSGKRTAHDKVTYQQLQKIHKNGVSNFWREVKNVVESRQYVDISTISDKIDENLLK